MDYRIQNGVSYEFGAVSVNDDGINFCFAALNCRTFFVCIYNHEGRLLLRADMLKYHAFGNVYSMYVSPLSFRDIYYTVEKDGRIFFDPWLRNVKKLRKWGEIRRKGHIDPAMVYDREYDWEGDSPLKLDFCDIIAYELHVRGFTRHPSSKVQHRGTYKGLLEKLDHIKELSVNQIVLMPSYFFYEFDSEESSAYQDVVYSSNMKRVPAEKMNYWGFKNASFFLPKPEYSSSDDFVREFKDMVKALHRAGIELVMRFYFPDSVNRNIVLPCLEYWVREYHIDGFFLMGNDLPMELIITNDVLADTKIYYSHFDRGMRSFNGGLPVNRSLAVCSREYMTVARRYLKSDEDMLNSFIRAQSDNPADIRRINYITTYEGFTLNDLVSYDYKHNEENGEANRDGEDYNYSWNCGAEGPSRKKQIINLRLKQMKNILTMLMTARGVPMLYAGDEFMNSQGGNNNPYCQDNATGWLVWKDTMYSRELFSFIKQLVAFRREHPITHMCHEPRLMDSLSCGYPDLSYHAEQAWYPKLYNHIRHIGVMYCGKYAKRDDGSDDDFIYVAWNMHWEKHEFALPKLPKGLRWVPVISSDEELLERYSGLLSEKQESIETEPRSVLILKSSELKDGADRQEP
ncbi:MAG TPA: hypothetical protein DCL38_03120 [Lachnospiraceae bacterium]|nr:hypothetical protein [Lachnospiraceae bacterium]